MNFFNHLWNIKLITKLPYEKRKIVFYTEGPGNWPHLEPIITELLNRNQELVLYTSHAQDPAFDIASPLIKVAYVGEKSARTILFAGLEADVVVMTMPDLNTFHIKRSPLVKHYAYVHHSMVSHSMAYRKNAFDHFDSILCVGPHHEAEIRQMELTFGTRKKKCVKHGYGRLDTLLAWSSHTKLENNPKKILIAPSWGANGLLESYAQNIINPLINAHFDLTVRPHPMTRKLNASVLDGLEKRFGNMANFHLDENISGFTSLQASDIMISDWSGAAIEFAFAFKRPVLFVDTPKKINNTDYEKVLHTPIEVSVREKIGQIIPLDRLDDIVIFIEKLLERAELIASDIKAVRGQNVFNIGNSHIAAADHIQNTLHHAGGEL